MKIKKVQKQEMVTKFHNQPKSELRVILLDYNPVQYTKAVVTISFILSIEFILVWQRN